MPYVIVEFELANFWTGLSIAPVHSSHLIKVKLSFLSIDCRAKAGLNPELPNRTKVITLLLIVHFWKAAQIRENYSFAYGSIAFRYPGKTW